ncbi:kti12, chromatin associated [Cryptotrichosporon argae]
MALITITGYPCSGKSTRAHELRRHFEGRLADPTYTGPPLSVVVVDDEGSHVSRAVYDDSIPEKSGRANLFTAVTRALSPTALVIVDSANYIKGFRYQMYCAAREAHARVCTMHVATPPDKCREWHETRGELSYKPATFDNLIMRYEEPSSMVRWDSPLFTVAWDEPAPAAAVWDAVTSGRRAPPTQAVLARNKPPPNTLQTLTTTTTTIITALQSYLSLAPSATTFAVPAPPAPGPLTLRLPGRPLPLPELQRLKRQFEAAQMQGPRSGAASAGLWTESEVGSAFVSFLGAAWGTTR